MCTVNMQQFMRISKIIWSPGTLTELHDLVRCTRQLQPISSDILVSSRSNDWWLPRHYFGKLAREPGGYKYPQFSDYSIIQSVFQFQQQPPLQPDPVPSTMEPSVYSCEAASPSLPSPVYSCEDASPSLPSLVYSPFTHTSPCCCPWCCYIPFTAEETAVSVARYQTPGPYPVPSPPTPSSSSARTLSTLQQLEELSLILDSTNSTARVRSSSSRTSRHSSSSRRNPRSASSEVLGRGRRHDSFQISALRLHFSISPFITVDEVRTLADVLEMEDRSVRNWFASERRRRRNTN